VRAIAHIDMDAFFASVEERLNPTLQGKPLIVGGDLERRGVVSSANYVARPFGIRAGMPVAEARRLCPHAIFVEGNPQKYVHLSLQILETLKDFTPIVEPFSIDEAFLDLTAVLPRPIENLEAAVPTARSIQRAILRRVGLTATIGIAPNKYVAKMASGVEKPRGLTVLSVERYRETFWPRGVQELWGIGEKTRASLERLGIRTVGHLARFPRELLTYHFGLNGDHMRVAARGDDDTPVTPYYDGVPVKSMGHEFTLPQDLHQRDEIGAHLLRLSDQLGRRMRQDGYLGRIVAVKFRDASFHTTIRQHALPTVTDDDHEIYRAATELLHRNWDGRPLRLIGVSVSGLVSAAGLYQHRMFERDEHRREMLVAVDALRDRFGDAALVKAGAIR
jgi:DNA polymerase IV